MDFLINFLKTGLDGSANRQRALANNIANINTPEFKREDVDFLTTLKEEASSSQSISKSSLKVTDSKHISFNYSDKPFKKIHISNTSSRNDGNNIDIEYEMAELAKNNIYYNTLSQQVSKRFSSLNNVIEKGGR